MGGFGQKLVHKVLLACNFYNDIFKLKNVFDAVNELFPSPDVGECPVVGRIVSTCNVVSHLMGGYRQLLTNTCHQYEACSLCVSSIFISSNT